jgi:hypothetical protein
VLDDRAGAALGELAGVGVDAGLAQDKVAANASESARVHIA